MDIKETIKKIANNALYFDDNSDYESALWEILEIVAPELCNGDNPDLKFIDDIESVDNQAEKGGDEMSKSEDIEKLYDRFFGTGYWEKQYKQHIVQFAKWCIEKTTKDSVKEDCPDCKGERDIAVWKDGHFARCDKCNSTGKILKKQPIEDKQAE